MSLPRQAEASLRSLHTLVCAAPLRGICRAEIAQRLCLLAFRQQAWTYGSFPVQLCLTCLAAHADILTWWCTACWQPPLPRELLEQRANHRPSHA